MVAVNFWTRALMRGGVRMHPLAHSFTCSVRLQNNHMSENHGERILEVWQDTTVRRSPPPSTLCTISCVLAEFRMNKNSQHSNFKGYKRDSWLDVYVTHLKLVLFDYVSSINETRRPSRSE